MANLGNLKFTLGLDDRKFDKALTADIQKVERLRKEASLLNAELRKASAQNKKDKTLLNDTVKQEIAKQKLALATARAAAAEERLNNTRKRGVLLENQIASAAERTNTTLKKRGGILGLLGTGAAVFATQKTLRDMIRITGEFELQRTSLKAILGDAEAAERIFAGLSELALVSPYQLESLTAYSKQLVSYGVGASELLPTLRMLADISSGLGADLGRSILAFGQIRAAGFLKGSELRQLTELGVPMIEMLAHKYSQLKGEIVSVGDVLDMVSARQVSFADVADIFRELTSEGGMFYKMQEKQSETLKGKISNLKDAYFVMLDEIGTGVSPVMKDSVDWLKRLMENYEAVGKTILQLVAGYGVYKTTLIVITRLSKEYATAEAAQLRVEKMMQKTLLKNPYALIAAGVAALSVAVYKLATYQNTCEKGLEKINKISKEYASTLSMEEANIKTLLERLGKLTAGTEEYTEVKNSLLNQYGKYLSDQDKEALNVGNLVGLYDKLRESIANTYREQYLQEGVEGIKKQYSETFRGIYEEIKKTVGYGNASKEAKKEISEYIKNLKEYKDLSSGAQRLYNENNEEILEKRVNAITGAWELVPSGRFRNNFDELRKETAKASEEIDFLTTSLSDDLEIFYTVDFTPKAQAEQLSNFQRTVQDVLKSFDKDSTFAWWADNTKNTDYFKYLDGIRGRWKEIGEQMKDTGTTQKEMIPALEKEKTILEAIAKTLGVKIDTTTKQETGTTATPKANNALEKFQTRMDQWMAENFDVAGNGIIFDLSSISSKLLSEYGKLDLKRKAALTALSEAKNELSEEEYNKQLEQIKGLYDKEKAYLKANADEKIRSLSGNYLSEAMKEKNVDLKDFADKSLSQIQTLIGRMEEIRSEIYEKIASISDTGEGVMFETDSAVLEMLRKALEELGIKIKDTVEESNKKMFANAGKSAQGISSIGSEIERLGANIQDADVENFGKVLGDVGEMAQSVFSALQSKDFISLAINVLSLFVKRLVDAFSSAAAYQQELTAATREYNNALNELALNNYDTIFGVDEMGRAAENARILTDAMDAYSSAVDEFENKKYRKTMAADMLDYGGYFAGVGKKTTKEVLEVVFDNKGWELYKNDKLNIEALKAYYDSYADYLTAAQKLLVKNIINSGEDLNEATEQQADYLKNTFDDLANTISKNMVDAFLKTGDAAYDMGNDISKIIQNLAADLLATVLLFPIINEYKKKVEDIWANPDLSTEEKTNQTTEIMKGMQGELEVALNQGNAILAQIKGLDTGTEDSSTTGVIKGMSEETASLLSSYINSIRADVATNKNTLLTLCPDIRDIKNSMLGINDIINGAFLHKIDEIVSNTGNNAASAEKIRQLLERAMTPEGEFKTN